MELRVESKITRIISPDIANSQVLNNLLKGDGNSDSFKVETVDQKDFIITPEQGTISINLFDHIVAEAADTVFIHAQCYRLVDNPLQIPSPIKFQTSIDSAVIGKMSQFQLCNLKDFDSDILFDGFDINPIVTISGDGTGATATATVVDGVITEIVITAGGSGYTNATAIIENGNGTGAELEVELTGNAVSAINVISGGSDYSPKAVFSIVVGSIIS